MAYFQDFLREKVSRRNYGLLAIPGGVQSLTMEEFLPKFSWAAWRHIKFLVDLDSPARVILIGHEECRWYQRGPMQRFLNSERDRQRADLRKVGASWKQRFPDSDIELYYATLSQGKAVFDEVK
jgi:hypothetical protein